MVQAIDANRPGPVGGGGTADQAGTSSLRVAM